MRHRGMCGRPTKQAVPCTDKPKEGFKACYRHISAAEREAAEQARRKLAELFASYPRMPTPRPACWSWPASDADREQQSLYHWQASRCAVCGKPYEVLDHDHETGWIRGYLCRGCNISEGSSGARIYQRYRRWNPARILGIWERYDSPFSGLDRGRLYGCKVTQPLVADQAGTVHLYPPWITPIPGWAPRPIGREDLAALSAGLAARMDQYVADLAA